LGGDKTLNSDEVSPICGVTANTNSLSRTGNISFIVLGYSELALSDSVLDRLISDLVPPLNRDSNAIPLPTYLGNLPVDS